jgi:3'-phosphoadenosine 5'-phosphosulfate (PAPS) 3'-phosphatase
MLKKDEIKHKWDEKDVVTEADIMIESCFREQIINFVPNYTIAWEEDAIDVHDKTKMILLDPIDGTKWFIKWVDKYWTVLGVYRNSYNIMSVVLNTKKWIIYFSDLNWFETYNIWEKDWKIIIKKNDIDVIDETEKDNIYLHLNFKWDDKFKNEEIKEKLEQWFKKFNKENNSNYNIAFMQTASDTWVRVW